MKNGYVGMETAIGTDGRPCVIVRRQVGGDGIRDTWLMVLAHAMGYTGQQLRLVRWIIDHADDDGYLHMAQRAIAKQSGISTATVARAFQSLQDGDTPFIVSADGGGYRINPDILRGDSLPRIVLDFSSSPAPPGDPAPEDPAPEDLAAESPAEDPTQEETKAEEGEQDLDPAKSVLTDQSEKILNMAKELFARYGREVENGSNEKASETLQEMNRLLLAVEHIGGVDLVAQLPWVVDMAYLYDMDARKYAKHEIARAHADGVQGR